MAHQITKVENKAADWKVVEILNATGDLIANVSVNRTSKKGDVFPDFDRIVAGSNVEGRLWESPNGKTYLFPIKGNMQQTQPRNQAPAANSAATQEIYNILNLQILPALQRIESKLTKKSDYPEFPEGIESPF